MAPAGSPSISARKNSPRVTSAAMRPASSSPSSHITTPSASTHAAASRIIRSTAATSAARACRMVIPSMAATGARRLALERTAGRAATWSNGEHHERQPHGHEAGHARPSERLVVERQRQHELNRRRDELQQPHRRERHERAPPTQTAAAARWSRARRRSGTRRWPSAPCRNTPVPRALGGHEVGRAGSAQQHGLERQAFERRQRRRLLHQAVGAEAGRQCRARSAAVRRTPSVRIATPTGGKRHRDPLSSAAAARRGSPRRTARSRAA